MGDEILRLAKEKTHLALVFFLPNKQRIIYRDSFPVLSLKLQCACVFVKHLNFKDLILENKADPMDIEKATWEEQYQSLLDKLKGMECCEQCTLILEDVLQRTFLIDNRQEFLEHLEELRKLHKAKQVLPEPVMLIPYDEDYAMLVEQIKDIIIEQVDVEETCYFFALEYWDVGEEEYRVYTKYKNDPGNVDVQFLIDLMN
jgi:hypothetical protein